MRKRPFRESEKKFIEGSVVDKEEKVFLKNTDNYPSQNVHLRWPALQLGEDPQMNEGSNLRKPISLPLKEFEWNTVDEHTKHLGVGKTEWIRYAIYKLLAEEQKYYSSEMTENET